MTFDPEKILAEIHEARALNRARTPRISRLDRYRDELLSLREKGASLRDLQTFLRRYHHHQCHESTLSRWLTKNAPIQKS